MTKDQNEEQKVEEMTRSQQIAASATRVLDSAGEKIPPHDELERLAEDATAYDVLLLNKVNHSLTEIVSYMPARASHFMDVVAGAFRIAANELDVRKIDLAMVIFASLTTFLVGISHVLAAAFDPHMSFSQAYEVIYENSARHFDTISDAVSALGIVTVPIFSALCLLLSLVLVVSLKIRGELGRYRLMRVDGNKIKPNWASATILMSVVASIIFLIQWFSQSDGSQGNAGLYAVGAFVIMIPSLMFFWTMFSVANNNTLFASFDEIRMEIRSAVLAYKIEAEAKGEEPDFVFTEKVGICNYDETPFFDSATDLETEE